VTQVVVRSGTRLLSRSELEARAHYLASQARRTESEELTLARLQHADEIMSEARRSEPPPLWAWREEVR
jgi:hypothetical protein